MRTYRRVLWGVAVAWLSLSMPARPDTVSWVGGTGDWFSAANWTNSSGASAVPGPGDVAQVRRAGSIVRLTNETAPLAGFALTAGTLVFSNWSTRLQAEDVAVLGGSLQAAASFTNTQMSNRVWVSCAGFTLATGATINVDARGYARLQGPGAGIGPGGSYGSGGGHGGRGGVSGASGEPGGERNDDPAAPWLPGSGGGNSTYGGAGGGAVLIEAGGTATVFGTITANGEAALGTHGAGGAGGSIQIRCRVLAGSTNGLLRANGAGGQNNGSGGGGGRIAVLYDPAAQAAEPDPGVRFQTAGAAVGFRPGEHGTVYLPDAGFLSEVIRDQLFRDCFLLIPGFTEWSLDRLTISNASFTLGNPGTIVAVTNGLLVTSGGIGLVADSELRCGGDIALTNGSSMWLYAGPTSGLGAAYSVLACATGVLRVATNCWVYPYADPTNGGAALLRAGGVAIAAGGGVNADAKGFAKTRGPGAGVGVTPYGGGAGHGGAGAMAQNYAARGATYDDPAGPALAGSGGGHAMLGGAGGGVIAIEAATGTVTIAGTLTANAESALSTHGGGGSGGGIRVVCSRYDGGASGLVRAGGGSGISGGGGGGGGRVAMLYDPSAQAGVNPGVRFSAARSGGGYPGASWRVSEDGSVYFPDASLLSTNPPSGFVQAAFLHIGGLTEWAPESLTLNNCSLVFAYTGLVLAVTNDVELQNGGTLGVSGNSRLACRSLRVMSGGVLALYAGATNAALPNYGSLVDVREDMAVMGGGVVYPNSEYFSGGSPLFRVRDFTVAFGGTVNADARGFGLGQGNGRGVSYGGGGYGGRGGNGSGASPGGAAYGSTFAPVHPGSSAGTNTGTSGSGGGLIRVEAGRNVALDGVLSADGEPGFQTHGPGGAGGGVFVKCGAFSNGVTGRISAKGGTGNGNGAGGGGGRIAIWRFSDISSVPPSNNVNGAAGYANGATGTVFVVITAPAVTNEYVTNVTDSAGAAVGSLTATGFSPTAVCCFWGEGDGLSNRDAWANTNWFGTNAPAVFTNELIGLSPGTVYHARFYATNDAGEAWAAPSLRFSTVGGAVTVDNGAGVGSLSPTSAVLRGRVLAGNPTPTAYVCWGDVDGGSDTGAWLHAVSIGEALGAFELPVGGLLANKAYAYRCFAASAMTSDWADASVTFTTPGPEVSIADCSVLEGNAGTTSAVFVVSLSATSVVDVTVAYASSNGMAQAEGDYTSTSGVLAIPAGQVSGTVAVPVNGDAEDEYPWETFSVGLSDPVSGVLARAAATCRIDDDDGVITIRTWSGIGDWSSATNWLPAGVPRAIDDAVIGSGLVRISSAKTAAAVRVSSGATVVFTNWYSLLAASNLVVQSGGTIGLPSAFRTNQTASRIWIACGELLIATGGLITADARGYAAGNGPFGGLADSLGGGGHGGAGGLGGSGTRPGAPYDSLSEPGEPGSGGGALGGGAGSGGGVVRIEVSGTASVFGTVSADGQDAPSANTAGGAGGAIYMACRALAGDTNGLIRAGGGGGSGTGSGGGGGRLSVLYDPGAQASVGMPGVRFLTSAGAAGFRPGEDGTLHLPDAGFLSTVLDRQFLRGVRLFIPGFTNWWVSSLTIRDCSVTFGPTGFVLAVDSDLLIERGGLGLAGDFRLTCGGGVTLTSGSSLWLYSGQTNGGPPGFSGLAEIAGALTVGSNCWVYPQSDERNGGSPRLRAGSMVVMAGGGFNADRRGYARTLGPGAGANVGVGGYGGGGGYGGAGAALSETTNRGSTYGAPASVSDCGSGGGHLLFGGYGGGLIRIEAPSGTVRIDGTLTANGGGPLDLHGGGGSGGGIYVVCRRFEGSVGGVLRANGAAGTGSGSPGGGGRIAVVYEPEAQGGYNPGVRFSASRGVGGYEPALGRGSEHGTLYVADASFLSTNVTGGLFRDVVLFVPGFTNWVLGRLTMDDCRLTLGGTGMVVSVTDGIELRNGSFLGLPGRSQLACRSLVVTGGSSFAVAAGPTNGSAGEYGALVEVRGPVSVATGCWVYAAADPMTGGAPLFRVLGDVGIDSGGGFSAEGRGYMSPDGPGRGGLNHGGGGHGGKGGSGSSGAGGVAYGLTNAPMRAGSSGNYPGFGGNGGGVVWIETPGTLRLDGTISANGDSTFGLHGGGGAGGSILVVCGRLLSSAGSRLAANGGTGTGNGGGGGGGRIAVWYRAVQPKHRDLLLAGQDAAVPALAVSNAYAGFVGTVSVTNGLGNVNPPSPLAAQPGSAVFLQVRYPSPGILTTIR